MAVCLEAVSAPVFHVIRGRTGCQMLSLYLPGLFLACDKYSSARDSLAQRKKHLYFPHRVAAGRHACAALSEINTDKQEREGKIGILSPLVCVVKLIVFL